MIKRASAHRRNVKPMMASPRCGSKTRAGTPCRSPAVSGKRRCRMHGGAKGSGAPRANQNALKHGFFTQEAIHGRRYLTEMLRESRETLRELE